MAGTGLPGNSGDGDALSSNLDGPAGLAVAGDGSLYIADRGNHRVRRVGPDNTITTVAGNGQVGDTGDGGFPLLSSKLLFGFGAELGMKTHGGWDRD